MQHLETLSRIDAYLDGSLAGPERAAMQAHLDACADCRAVLAAWQPEAQPFDLSPRVLARLRPAPLRAALPAWFAPLAGMAALLLALSAFWHPERAWLKADRAFAYSAADAAAPADLLGGR